MMREPEIIRLPGLIDVHVHLRDPGQTRKEDFTTGTSAALAGGFTTVVDMPNNAEPITNLERLNRKRSLATSKAVSDIGFHYGSLGDNLDTFREAAKHSVGLKLYLNKTTGGYLLDAKHLKKIYAAWPQDKVVLLHVEEDVIDVAIESMKDLKRPIHVCHMPSREILEKIIAAKRAGYPVTCGVCPHHLFLTAKDAEELGPYGKMLPSLKPKTDQQYLWDHLDDIDIFESDHAPHTHREKKEGAFGVPGLETTLPLLLTAEKQGRITRQQIIDKCFVRPAEIFNLPTDFGTYVEVSMEEYTIDNDKLQTKCGWSPFAGQKVVGKVIKTVIRGEVVYQNGKVIAKPGYAQVLSDSTKRIGSVPITTPVMNAACSVAKSIDDVKALSKTNVGIVLVGSITVEPREGNPAPQWFVGDNYALNSFGMPNGGLKFYKTNLPRMIDIVHKAGKKFALSVAGFTTNEYVQLAELAQSTGVDLLELNLGCPNVRVDGKQKPIVSFDPATIKEIINAVSKVTTMPMMLKLSPYSNPADLSRAADVINTSGRVDAVVTMNTMPNGYYAENGQPVIATTYGGVSGSAVLPIALGQVRQFRSLLDEDIKVVGVGGIENARDVQQFMAAGADLVQCATLIVRDGHQAINKVIA